MPDIDLSLIRPNPFRDFELHPIDEAQVEKLRWSIEGNGFWAGVVARPSGDGYELAFGHHRIEAARRAGKQFVPIDARPLTDWQMVLLLTSENATQRGVNAAASLDSIAAICRKVIADCVAVDDAGVSKIFETLPSHAADSVLGKLAAGDGPGEPCIVALTGKQFTTNQVRLALAVLRDSGRMAQMVADALGRTAEPEVTFDPRCAHLFKTDYHLQEFRRIVTGEVVRSYLPVEKQVAFAQQIIAAVGSEELTAIKLRERANVIFYEDLGMPRHAMRNSPLRLSDDRVKDALNLMRRGTHSVKQCCRMLETLIAEGVTVAPEVVNRFYDYVTEIDVALKSLRPKPKRKQRSNLHLIVNRKDVA